MGASPRKARAEWDDSKDMYLIRHILQATREGKKSDTGFKKDVFHALTTKFNTKYKATLQWSQVKTRITKVYLL